MFLYLGSDTIVECSLLWVCFYDFEKNKQSRLLIIFE